jgi:hypothetical protein
MNKEELLQQALQEVDCLADGLGYGIEPFIKRPVAILMTAGFSTVASCEGHTDRGLPYPWIDIDNLPNFPHEIHADEATKIFNDEVAFKKLIDSNHSSQKKIENLLEQSGFFAQSRLEIYGIHHSIRLCVSNRQAMSDFTEWLFAEKL